MEHPIMGSCATLMKPIPSGQGPGIRKDYSQGQHLLLYMIKYFILLSTPPIPPPNNNNTILEKTVSS